MRPAIAYPAATSNCVRVPSRCAKAAAAAIHRVGGDGIRGGSFRNNRPAVARTVSAEAAWQFRYRSIRPCFAPLRDRIFPKFVQVILQLTVRVKEPRTYRSFGDTQDF